MTQKAARLTIEGQEPVDLPIYSPTLGNDVIDINELGSSGIFTFDPGFMSAHSTSKCNSVYKLSSS